MEKLVNERLSEMNRVFIHYSNHYNVTSGLNNLKHYVLPSLEKEHDRLKEALTDTPSELLNQRLFGIESSIYYINLLIATIEQED